MTYSIVARDKESGELGVAVQSHFFAAGSIVPWAEAGVGAVATQASVLITYGPDVLASLREGRSVQEALGEALASDPDAEHRQVAVVDTQGSVAVHTGAACIPEAGHAAGEGFSVQANMMRNDGVPEAMARAYRDSRGDLASRLMDALDAAEEAGGDIRGRQAAGLLLVRAQGSGKVWQDVRMHLHVDDDPAPLRELRRLVGLRRVYDKLQEAEDLELAGDAEAAYTANLDALEAAPENTEVAFWGALALAKQGDLSRASEAIRVAYAADPGWSELLRRLADRGLVELEPEAVRRLLEAAR
jgi:uncharacterized Ntn-hydrolase superfamily protein